MNVITYANYGFVCERLRNLRGFVNVMTHLIRITCAFEDPRIGIILFNHTPILGYENFKQTKYYSPDGSNNLGTPNHFMVRSPKPSALICTRYTPAATKIPLLFLISHSIAGVI